MRRRYGYLATSSVEKLYFQILLFQCYRVKPIWRLYLKMAMEPRPCSISTEYK